MAIGYIWASSRPPKITFMAPMRDSGAQSQVSLYITTGPPHGYIGPPRGPSCTLYRAKSRLAIFPFNENGGPPTAPLRGQQTQNHCLGPWGVPLGHLAGGKPDLNFRLKNSLAVISSKC